MVAADIDVANERIVLVPSWSEKDRLQLVPGVSFSAAKVWSAPLSWGSCIVLRGVFGADLVVSDALREWAVAERRSWVDPALRLREAIDLNEVVGPDTGWYGNHVPDERLYPPQRVGVVFFETTGGALLADEMGVGKTPQVLVSLGALDDALPALVICPKSVKQHWEAEAATWCPDAVPYVIDGGAGKRRDQLEAAAADEKALVIMNFEAIRLHSRLAPYGSVRLSRCEDCGGGTTVSRCEVHLKELNNIPFKTVVVDEAHRMKDPKSKQTRSVWFVQRQDSVTRRWSLTGTPIANHVGDLWSIMHGVAPKDFPTRGKFIDRYALLAWNRYAALDIVGVRPDTQEEFNQLIKPRMRRMLKSVVLPFLPPKVRQIREAEMIPKQAKAYREVETEFITELEDGAGTVLVGTNLTKALRLIQFSSSYCTVTDEGGIRLSEPSPKLDVLEEIIDELGEDRQVAVCASSRQLIEMAAARLNDPKTLGWKPSYRLLTGKIPHPERAKNLMEFQAGEAQVMLFTIAAGGVGVNMSAADTIVFLQRSWSMLENRQAEDRVHRVGSERHESISIIDIVAPNTIEERQLRKLREKQERLEEIVRDREQLLARGISASELDVEEQSLLAGHLL